MDWKVENALSRDVERQQLNKILKDVRAAIDAANKTIATNANADIKAIVGQMFTGNTEIGVSAVYNAVKKVIDLSVPNFFIRLQGDVEGTGQVNALGDVTIVTSLADGIGGVEEAPSDGSPYWRNTEEWEQVPVNVQQLATLTDVGLVTSTSANTLEARTIEGTAGNIVVTDGDGDTANPTIDLADLADSGVGVTPVKLFTRDAKGRISGTQNADTDDLPEGASNLYFTDERAQDAVGSILTDSATVTWDYDDVANTITANSTGGHSEILVTGAVGPVALTTNDETDWLYTG